MVFKAALQGTCTDRGSILFDVFVKQKELVDSVAHLMLSMGVICGI